ncbi:MAG: hypothetical protein ACOX16_04125 [Candidatus Izemoplasmatales bacterium]|jgi:hypothetical protein
MKGIVKILLGILIALVSLLVVFVGIPLFLLNMKTTAPIEQYVEASETSFYTSFSQELETLITDSEKDEVFFRIDEAFINRMIQKTLSEGNPQYLNPENENQIAHDYMMVYQDIVGLKGVWTELSDDQIIVRAGADLVLGKTPIYQTGLEIVFNIVLSENDEYYLQIVNIKIGRLKPSLRRAFNLADTIITKLTKKSLNDMIAEYLAFGMFDTDELSFTVSETELTDFLYDIEPSFAALLKIIYKESLLILDVTDMGFDISIGIGALRRLITDPDEPLFTKWEDEFDKAEFMAAMAAQAVLNSVFRPFDPQIDLTEADVNAILDYTLGDDVKFEFPIEFTLGEEDIKYSFSSTNIYARMQDDVLTAHLRMMLTKEGMAGSFDMQFNLETSVSMNTNGDMILSITNANIGEAILDDDLLETLFAIFDDALLVDGDIVISKDKLNEMFEGSGIIINDSYVVDGKLRLHFGLDNIG